jgi:hypothetical protein
MRLKVTLFTSCLFLLLMHASAQQVFTIHGLVSEKETGDRVSQVVVRNVRSNDIMMSDELGVFNIKAAIGDTLVFSKKEFGEQKISVVSVQDLSIIMQSVIELKTVTVQGQSSKSELKDVMKGYGQDGIFNNGKSLPVWQFLNSPLTGFYNLFGAEPARARHFAAFSKQELQAEAVDKRYTIAFVKQVTGANDDQAKEFMQYYVPEYDDIKVWNDYDLAKQVKKRYDYYQANKGRINHKDLPALPQQSLEDVKQ